MPEYTSSKGGPAERGDLQSKYYEEQIAQGKRSSPHPPEGAV